MRRERVARWFEENFGGEPVLWSRAPGRVDLMGSHTDYNLGFVLTLAISRDTWVAARPREDSIVRLYSANLGALDSFDLRAIPVREKSGAMGRLSARSGLGACGRTTVAQRVRRRD
jgi:galactokinase